MRRGAVVAVVVLGFVGSGCSAGGEHVVATGREHGVPRPRGGESGGRMRVALSSAVRGEPGNMAADQFGMVVEIGESAVVALDWSGREQWSTPVDGAELTTWPWLGNGLVVMPTAHGHGSGGCVALDRETGVRLWAHEERGASGAAVARSGREIICALSDGVVVAIDLATGVPRWRAVLVPDLPRSAVAIPTSTALAVDEETGSVGFTVDVGGRWAVALLGLETGADNGAFDLGGVRPLSAPEPIAAGVLAVGVSVSRQVCALDLRRLRVGVCVAEPRVSGFDPESIPALTDGVVVITASDGSVSAIDFGARKVRWTVDFPQGNLDSRPVVAGDVVLLAAWSHIAAVCG